MMVTRTHHAGGVGFSVGFCISWLYSTWFALSSTVGHKTTQSLLKQCQISLDQMTREHKLMEHKLMEAPLLSPRNREDEALMNINEFYDVFTASDKTWRHGYQWFYGRHLSSYRGKEDLAILEVGSHEGDSALAWTKYFGNYTSIDMVTYGGNNNAFHFKNPTLNCTADGTNNCGRIRTFYCDQSDAKKLENEVAAAKPDGWDIVVDDGSHVPAHNAISFEVLWKHVRPGGIYIVEDIETSYYPKTNVYGYGIDAGILADPPLNALSRFRQYVDVINRGYLGPKTLGYSLFEGDHSIMEIGFARNVIFVRKALEGIDHNGKSYDQYPFDRWELRGYSDIDKEVEEALELFKKQSTNLDKWRPNVK